MFGIEFSGDQGEYKITWSYQLNLLFFTFMSNLQLITSDNWWIPISIDCDKFLFTLIILIKAVANQMYFFTM